MPTIRPITRATPAETNAAAVRRLAQTFVIIGAIVTAIGGRWVIRDRALLGPWPTVYGEVIETAIGSTRTRTSSGPSDPTYDVQVTFAYTLNNNRLQSQALVGAAAASRERVAELLKTYAKGSHHPILVRPDNPSVIAFEVSRLRLFARSGGAVLLGVGFMTAGIVLQRRRRRQSR